MKVEFTIEEYDFIMDALREMMEYAWEDDEANMLYGSVMDKFNEAANPKKENI